MNGLNGTQPSHDADHEWIVTLLMYMYCGRRTRAASTTLTCYAGFLPIISRST
jgi:hypothetical protein